jgi:hypothetical protein
MNIGATPRAFAWPPEFALWHEVEPMTLDRLRASMIH